jgi:hypothetical protein
MFNLLAIHTKAGAARAPSRPIIRALEEDHEVPPEISAAVIRLFSTDTAGAIEVDSSGDLDVEWVADTKRMVQEVGRGLLETVKGANRLDLFEGEWREAVSVWEGLVDISMLQVRPR